MTWIEKLIKIYMDSRERVMAEIEKKLTWGYSTAQEQALIKAIDKELVRLNADAKEWSKAAVQDSFVEGASSVFKAVSPAKPLPAFSAFTGLHKRSLGLLVDNSTSFLFITNNLIARQAQDRVREIGVAITTKKVWRQSDLAGNTQSTRSRAD